jgi:hypothetical protein
MRRLIPTAFSSPKRDYQPDKEEDGPDSHQAGMEASGGEYPDVVQPFLKVSQAERGTESFVVWTRVKSQSLD